MQKRSLLIAVALLSVALLAAQNKKNVTQSGLDGYTVSGAELYKTYCASCHGLDGKGNGPAAGAMKRQPSDLTEISRRSGGQFPSFRIMHIIDGYEVIEAHGTRDMPIWGDLLPQHRDEALLTLREHNLTEYIQSMQK